MHLKYLTLIAFYCVTVCGINVQNTTLNLSIPSNATTTNTTTIKEVSQKVISRKISSTAPINVPPFKNETKLNSTVDQNNMNNTLAEAIKSTTSQIDLRNNTTTASEVTPKSNLVANDTSLPTPTITNLTSSTTKEPTTITTQTTNKTTPKHKKPLITESLDEHKILSAPMPPKTEPVRDASATRNMHTDMFVPLLTIIFTIPLAAAVIITSYRKFRDCWSTRHYSRMDFLVDGMYND